MTAPRTGEQRRLAGAAQVLGAFAARHASPSRAQEARFQLLEAAASRFGGFDLEAYHTAFSVRPMVALGDLVDAGRDLAGVVEASGLPPPLALSALAREQMPPSRQRVVGAYHTDFRLALNLAGALRTALRPGAALIDPACGAGMLLAAAGIVACGADRRLAAEWLAASVHAADLSPLALRGTLVALSCLTDDLGALRAMRSRWRAQDSLLAADEAWAAMAPGGFDVVLANPPWEKLKLSRHEFIKARGGARHYGAEYDGFELSGYAEGKAHAAGYVAALAARYATLRDGEPDLYVAFVELLLRLAKAGASGGFIAPAGLIRSKNTEALRRLLAREADDLRVTVMENRAAFFPIDTRFKFVVTRFGLAAPGAGRRRAAPLHLSHARGTDDGAEETSSVTINRRLLAQVRPDLTVPEVRGRAEWRLFLKMQRGGVDWSNPTNSWWPEIVREVDMTNARSLFADRPGPGRLPLAEGRMVQPHRFGAKAYKEGRGRRARWITLPPGFGRVAPQFWLAADGLAPRVRERVGVARAGFCDITGQTNERSMMAALVPAGVACGNKVPTVLFPNDPRGDRLFLWLAIVNSFAFDWLLRRVVTTTVNFFLLLGLRLPPLDPESLPGRRLAAIARRLSGFDSARRGGAEALWQAAELRAEADALVASAYGITPDELELMLADFPLLDRGQPPIPGERTSTVTRDLVLWRACGRQDGAGGDPPWRERVDAARRAGAVAYVPSQVADVIEERAEVA